MTDSKLRLGFIGLGLMGQGFTQRLIDCGYEVTGFDLEPAKIDQAARHGVKAASSPAEVAAASNVVLMCITSTRHVKDAVFGDNGIAKGAQAGSILVDHSTTTVNETRAMAQRLREETGMGWVDAPVSGGPDGALAGTLAIMAGGDENDVKRIQPVMDALASTFTLFGPVGSGQVAKMVNQVLVLNNYAVLAEALALAEAGGINAEKIPAALATGHAGSNLLKTLFPRMIARDFAPKGYARQVLKDLDMLHDLAKDLNTPTPVSNHTASLYRLLNSKGYEELDGVAILKLFDKHEKL